MNGFFFGAGKLIAGKIKIGGMVPDNESIERQPIPRKKFLGITLDKKWVIQIICLNLNNVFIVYSIYIKLSFLLQELLYLYWLFDKN